MTGVVNSARGYVFVHVPKCAGTSISAMLMRQPGSVAFDRIPGMAEALERENAVSSETVLLPMHARARDARNAIGAEVFDRMDSFAVVRDPWDRLASLYRHYRKRPTHWMYAHTSGGFDPFVRWWSENRPATQTERLTDRSRRNVLVRHILRFETLDRELSELRSRVPIGDDALALLNTSKDVMAGEAYAPESVDIVRRVYEDDFTLFGYRDEPPETLVA